MFIAPVLLYIVISRTMAAALGAYSGEHQEMLTVPIQQLARTYNAYEDEISEEDAELLKKYLPDEALNLYTPRVSDLLKSKFDNDAYSKVFGKLSNDVYEIEEMKSSYVKGNITADEDGIMMTSIQSGVGFNVFVDGELTDYETIGGALIGVPLSKGKHVVEFKYGGMKAPINSRTVADIGKALYIIMCAVYIIYRIKHKNTTLQVQNEGE